MPRIPTLALAVPLLLLSAGAAFAHAHLKTAEPAVDSTVTTPPTHLTIAFTEGVEPKFSTIEVRDSKDQRVDKADPHTAPADATRLSVSLAALPPGLYTVVWHATAVDTHKTEGNFHFTVAATAAGGGIGVTHAWARATPPNAQSAAAYLTLTDQGPADTVTGASTPVAAMAGLHETISEGGVMKMRPLPPLALEPGKPVTFAPGGMHIMLTELKQPLKAGEHFPLTLTFAHAPPLTVEVAVEAIGAAAAPMNHDGMSMDGMSMGGVKMGGPAK
jgi:copper(I)-binding protein